MPRYYSRDEDSPNTIAHDFAHLDVRMPSHTTSESLLSRDDIAMNAADDDEEFMLNPSNLNAPEARQGFRQRWIDYGQDETGARLNWANKMRQGWRPRDPNTVSPAERALYPTIKQDNSGAEDWIQVGSLVLCELPMRLVEKRNKQVWERTMHQEAAAVNAKDRFRSVEQQGRGAMSYMGTNVDGEDGTEVHRGNGRRPPTMVD